MENLKKGFTLIELIIYIGMFAGASILLTGILTTVLRVQSREAVSTDISNQLTLVLDTVTRLVRESSSIESVFEGSEGTPCVTRCSVELIMPDSAVNPTIISTEKVVPACVTDCLYAIYLKQGAGSPIALTNDKVTVDKLFFTIDRVGAHSILNIDVWLKANNLNPQLQITRSLKSSIGKVSYP